MTRMKWITCSTGEPGLYRSACGRWMITVYTLNGYFGYLLMDAQTGKEHICRTIDSAKTTARNISSGRYQIA